MKRALPILLAAGLGIFGAWRWRTSEASVEARQFSGTIEARQILVGSKTGGRVTEVLVEEGDRVEPNQPLVRFDVRELRAQRLQAEGRLREAESRLARLRNGSRPEEKSQAEAAARQQAWQLDALRRGPRRQEIAQAEADLQAAEADLANAEAMLKRVKSLAESGDIARQQLDDATTRRGVTAARADAARQRVALLRAGSREEDIRAQQARLDQATAQSELVRTGARREDIAEAEARVMQARAALEELDVRLAEGEVRAPATAIAEVVSVRPGDLVPAGRSVATLLEPARLWVRIFIPEPALPLLAVGHKVEVEAVSAPGVWYGAHIEQIASQGEFLPRNVQTRSDREHLVYGARVRLDAASHPLKSGMAVNVRPSAQGGARP